MGVKTPPHVSNRQALASNLKYARVLMAVTQEELGKLAKLHRTQVGVIERAATGVSIDTLGLLAKAIGVPSSVLLEPPEDAHPQILASMGRKKPHKSAS